MIRKIKFQDKLSRENINFPGLFVCALLSASFSIRTSSLSGSDVESLTMGREHISILLIVPNLPKSLLTSFPFRLRRLPALLVYLL